MSVQSRDIPASRQRRNIDFAGISLAFLGVVFGFVLWLLSARYTVDGVLVLTNVLLSFLNVPYRIVVPPAFPIYLILSPVPTLMTYAEWQKQPFYRNKQGDWVFEDAQHWVVWAVVLGLDGWTNFTGLGVDPGPSGLTIQREVAENPLWRGIIAGAFTGGPEWIWRWCRRQFRKSVGHA